MDGAVTATFDVVVVLGAQLVNTSTEHGKAIIVAAPHTEQRVVAAGVAYHRGMTSKFIVSGGYNFGVRYWADKAGVNPSVQRSFDACALAQTDGLPSEARLIAGLLHERHGVPRSSILLEESSTDTIENAELVKVLLRRQWLDLPQGNALRVGLLTSASHMDRALAVFRDAGVAITGSIVAETLLPLAPRAF